MLDAILIRAHCAVQVFTSDHPDLQHLDILLSTLYYVLRGWAEC